MITPTIQLDKAKRPCQIPDHFVAYRVDLEDNDLTAVVTFLRLRVDDPELWEFLADQNEGLTGSDVYRSTYACPSSVHYMLRAPNTAAPAHKLFYKRESKTSVWVQTKDDALERLLRAFNNPSSAPADRI